MITESKLMVTHDSFLVLSNFITWTIMVQKENLVKPNFISKIGEATLIKVGVHAYNIKPYLHDFEPIPFDLNFQPPLTIVHGLKGKFGQI